MTKHPLDRDRTTNDQDRAVHYTKIERESGPAGAHPTVQAALKRPRAEDRSSDLARKKRLAVDEV